MGLNHSNGRLSSPWLLALFCTCCSHCGYLCSEMLVGRCLSLALALSFSNCIFKINISLTKKKNLVHCTALQIFEALNAMYLGPTTPLGDYGKVLFYFLKLRIKASTSKWRKYLNVQHQYICIFNEICRKHNLSTFLQSDGTCNGKSAHDTQKS